MFTRIEYNDLLAWIDSHFSIHVSASAPPQFINWYDLPDAYPFKVELAIYYGGQEGYAEFWLNSSKTYILLQGNGAYMRAGINTNPWQPNPIYIFSSPLDISNNNFSTWYCQNYISSFGFYSFRFVTQEGITIGEIPYTVGYNLSKFNTGIYNYGKIGAGGASGVIDSSMTEFHLSSTPYDLVGDAV
jgi:hypothetical protein